jgi:flagellar hook-associated protein 3 FlgL
MIMRISDSVGYRNLLDNLDMLNARLEQSTEEVSSGQRLSHLHVAPADSAEMVQLNDQLAGLDQFKTNADSGGYFLHVSDSTLSTLYNLVTSVYTAGSEAANSFNDANTLSAIASQIQSQLDQVLSLANTQVEGRYIFAGSQTTSPAFTMAGGTATYQGDNVVNTIQISDGLQVEENIPGSAVFSPVFASVESLLAAIQSGDQSAIKSSLGQFSSTLATVNQVRARLGVNLGKLEDAQTAIQTEETNVKTRQSHIGDVDMAAAISQLSQTQTALQAAQTAGALVKQHNLFDYLA